MQAGPVACRIVACGGQREREFDAGEGQRRTAVDASARRDTTGAEREQADIDTRRGIVFGGAGNIAGELDRLGALAESEVATGREKVADAHQCASHADLLQAGRKTGAEGIGRIDDLDHDTAGVGGHRRIPAHIRAHRGHGHRRADLHADRAAGFEQVDGPGRRVHHDRDRGAADTGAQGAGDDRYRGVAGQHFRAAADRIALKSEVARYQKRIGDARRQAGDRQRRHVDRRQRAEGVLHAACGQHIAGLRDPGGVEFEQRAGRRHIRKTAAGDVGTTAGFERVAVVGQDQQAEAGAAQSGRQGASGEADIQTLAGDHQPLRRLGKTQRTDQAHLPRRQRRAAAQSAIFTERAVTVEIEDRAIRRDALRLRREVDAAVVGLAAELPQAQPKIQRQRRRVDRHARRTVDAQASGGPLGEYKAHVHRRG